jgi:hypothetical protein
MKNVKKKNLVIIVVYGGEVNSEKSSRYVLRTKCSIMCGKVLRMELQLIT